MSRELQCKHKYQIYNIYLHMAWATTTNGMANGELNTSNQSSDFSWKIVVAFPYCRVGIVTKIMNKKYRFIYEKWGLLVLIETFRRNLLKILFNTLIEEWEIPSILRFVIHFVPKFTILFLCTPCFQGVARGPREGSANPMVQHATRGWRQWGSAKPHLNICRANLMCYYWNRV